MGTYDEKSNNWLNPKKPPRSPMDSGNNKSCCFGAAAVKAVRRRKFKLARRNAILCVRHIARRFA